MIFRMVCEVCLYVKIFMYESMIICLHGQKNNDLGMIMPTKPCLRLQNVTKCMFCCSCILILLKYVIFGSKMCDYVGMKTLEK
ncbi:hypothetical protein HanPSC8_Chr11g0472731 [Helianthus annuus]|nr:hypothetical protein HanPSC8_Chr11g0472731 [Helianthus annuus]